MRPLTKVIALPVSQTPLAVVPSVDDLTTGGGHPNASVNIPTLTDTSRSHQRRDYPQQSYRRRYRRPHTHRHTLFIDFLFFASLMHTRFKHLRFFLASVRRADGNFVAVATRRAACLGRLESRASNFACSDGLTTHCLSAPTLDCKSRYTRVVEEQG